jgi:hypothetical protein
VDDRDGNITSRLSAFGVGAVITSRPTQSASPYVISYDVKDLTGNSAPTAQRWVYVDCPKVRQSGLAGILDCCRNAKFTARAHCNNTVTGIQMLSTMYQLTI